MTADDIPRDGSRLRAVDLAWPSRPPRWLRRAPTAQPTILIETTCARPRIIDRVDLHSHGAAIQLSRYEIV
jgi:hypothetical protein